MAHVELQNVVKSYDGQNKVLHGINLTVSDGQFVVLVGPSGCGKSTLLRMVAGLETVTQGDILIDGVRINDLPPRDRDIAMVFQDYALYPHKSLFENMAFGLRLRKESGQEEEHTNTVRGNHKPSLRTKFHPGYELRDDIKLSLRL